MEQQTLYGEAEAKKRTPPPAWVVRKLVARGVSPETAGTFDNRQAFAVLSKLEDDAAEKSPVARPADDAPELYRGAGHAERLDAAEQLALVLKEHRVTHERLCCVVESVLYTLPHADMLRVVRGVEKVLRESCHERL